MQISNDYCIIIFAAGSSSRLGTPKQLLLFRNKTLIEHVVQTALEVTPSVVVVTGAHKASVEQVLQHYPVHTVFNQHYTEGMASSIHSGITEALQCFPEITYALLLVCDQPFVSVSLLQRLLAQRQLKENAIVASTYDDTVGVPVLLHHHYFNDLMNLNGDTGAKKIIQQHPESVTTVPFPEGNLDIDTKDDMALLNTE